MNERRLTCLLTWRLACALDLCIYLGRMTMAHFDIWHWADFVRGLCDEPTQSVMQAHLSSGCPSCQETVDTLRAIVRGARAEVA